MTSLEFKKVGRMLKELYKELESEALEEGIDIFDESFNEIKAKVRLALLEKLGFTLEEYREAKELVAPAKKVDVDQKIQDTVDQLNSIEIPQETEIEELARKIAQEYIKPPVVTNNTINKIVKETTIEKPTIVKETKTIIEREEYDDNPIYAELGYLNDRIDNIKIPEPVDEEKLETNVRNIFGELFEKNINILDMPNWRKLAMGLQGSIDTKVEGNGITKITVSDTAPANPTTNELWIDTSGYTYRDITTNDTLTAIDYLVGCSNTITVTLPTAVDFGGEYIIKNVGTGIITVATTSSQTIDGATTFYLIEDEVITLRSTNSNWLII